MLNHVFQQHLELIFIKLEVNLVDAILKFVLKGM